MQTRIQVDGMRVAAGKSSRAMIISAQKCCFITTSSTRGRADTSPTGGRADATVIRTCWLCGNGADRTRDPQPISAVGKRDRQMQHNTAHRALDPDTEFEQPLAQRAHLGACTLTTASTQAKLLHQYIGGGGEQHSQLVGEEVRATGAVDLQSMMQLFEAILDFSPHAVDALVQMSGGAIEIGHNVACVVFGLPTFLTYNLRLDEYAALSALPAAGGIARLSKHIGRLPASFGEPPRAAHPPPGSALQYLVFSQPDDVVDFRLFQEIQQLRPAESTVEAHQNARLGEHGPQPLDHPIQNSDRTLLGRRVASSQHITKQILVRLLVEGDKSGHWKIAPRVVMTVEESQLLRPVSRVICWIKIHSDSLYPATEPLAVSFDNALGQCFTHPIQICSTRRVLKTRQRRLRGECRAAQRVASDQKLLNRILRQPSRIITIRIPTGNAIQSLAYQIPDRVLDFARLPCIHDATRQPLRQAQSLVTGFQQDGPTIGTAVALVELHHHRTARQVWKQDRLSCDIFLHARAF